MNNKIIAVVFFACAISGLLLGAASAVPCTGDNVTCGTTLCDGPGTTVVPGTENSGEKTYDNACSQCKQQGGNMWQISSSDQDWTESETELCSDFYWGFPDVVTKSCSGRCSTNGFSQCLGYFKAIGGCGDGE